MKYGLIIETDDKGIERALLEYDGIKEVYNDAVIGLGYGDICEAIIHSESAMKVWIYYDDNTDILDLPEGIYHKARKYVSDMQSKYPNSYWCVTGYLAMKYGNPIGDGPLS